MIKLLVGAEREAAGGEPGDVRSRRLVDHWPWLLAVAVALVAAGRMLWWIRAGVHVQYADYWPILDQTFNSNGTLSLEGLTSFHQQHLLTGAQLTYAANTALFGGSNIYLGYWVLVLALVQVGILFWWLGRQPSVPSPVAAALAALTAVLLLSPHGAWNFLHAMSGTAWLSANLIVIILIHMAVRGRIVGALILSAIAAATYGTGIVAFPVVIVAVLALDRRARTLLPVIAVSAGALVAYSLLRSSTGVSGLRPPGPWDQLVNTATVVGGIMASTPSLASVVGMVTMIVVAVLGGLACWRGERVPVAWACLGFYGLVNAGLIGHSRHGWASGRENLLAGRYSSISALALIAAGGLVVSCFPWGQRAQGASAISAGSESIPSTRVPVVLSALVAVGLFLVAPILVLHGTEEVEAVQAGYGRTQHLAAAQAAKVSAGKQWFPMTVQPDIDDLLERLGHHPFDGRLEAGCGLLGESAPPAEPATGAREMTDQGDRDLPRGIRLQGRVDLPADGIDCVVVADESGTVVGVGLVEVLYGERTVLTAYVSRDHSGLVVLARTGNSWHEFPVALHDDG